MRLLLDTHVFLWFISADARCLPWGVDTPQDAGNEVSLVFSVWEAILKYAHGKLCCGSPRALSS